MRTTYFKMKNNCVILSVVISVVILLVMNGILAKLLLTGRIGEGSIKMAIRGLLGGSALAGGICAVLLNGKLELKVTAFSVMGVFLALFLGSFMFPGTYRGVLDMLLTVLVGVGLSCVLCMKKVGKIAKKKKRYR